jgi:hypothetical protein
MQLSTSDSIERHFDEDKKHEQPVLPSQYHKLPFRDHLPTAGMGRSIWMRKFGYYARLKRVFNKTTKNAPEEIRLTVKSESLFFDEKVTIRGLFIKVKSLIFWLTSLRLKKHEL